MANAPRTPAARARRPVTVKAREAKSTLSRLIQRVEAGGRVIIARNDVPVVELVSVAAREVATTTGIRSIGSWRRRRSSWA